MTKRQSLIKSSDGFTLVEALVATALLAMVLSAVATISSVWMPNWNRGILRLQRNESIAVGLERASADIAAAEFLPVGNNGHSPFFDGTPHSVTFVRTAVGPNARAGLEIIRIAEINTAHGATVVRMRAPFRPQYNPIEVSGDPVALMRAPYSLSMAYAGADRVWRATWRQQSQLPKAIKLTIRDTATRLTLAFSTAVLVHSELPAGCIEAKSFADCLLILGPTANTNNQMSKKQDG